MRVEMKDGAVFEAETADGIVSQMRQREWGARVPGTSARSLVVALWRIALRDLGDGRVKAFSINPSRPISEPGAKLVFKNAFGKSGAIVGPYPTALRLVAS